MVWSTSIIYDNTHPSVDFRASILQKKGDTHTEDRGCGTSSPRSSHIDANGVCTLPAVKKSPFEIRARGCRVNTWIILHGISEDFHTQASCGCPGTSVVPDGRQAAGRNRAAGRSEPSS